MAAITVRPVGYGPQLLLPQGAIGLSKRWKNIRNSTMTEITEARIEAVAKSLWRLGNCPTPYDITRTILEADARWLAENKPKPTLGGPLQTDDTGSLG
jgi:hypothetical protein